MKRLIYTLLLSFSLFSCSKGTDEEPKEEQLHNVSFKVETFSKGISNMKSASPLSDIAESLLYIVYNAENKILYYREFSPKNENYGIIQDKLPAGDYNIVFFASSKHIEINFPSDITDTYFNWEGLGDTFTKSLTISVPEDDSDFSVVLERVVGKLEVIFTDNIPENAFEMEYSLTDINAGIDLITGNPASQFDDLTKTGISIIDVRGTSNYKLELFSFVGSETVLTNLTIKIFDEDKNLIATKNIDNIDLYRNKITRFSGEMFTSTKDNENSFSLTVDTGWSEINEKDF